MILTPTLKLQLEFRLGLRKKSSAFFAVAALLFAMSSEIEVYANQDSNDLIMYICTIPCPDTIIIHDKFEAIDKELATIGRTIGVDSGFG